MQDRGACLHARRRLKCHTSLSEFYNALSATDFYFAVEKLIDDAATTILEKLLSKHNPPSYWVKLGRMARDHDFIDNMMYCVANLAIIEGGKWFSLATVLNRTDKDILYEYVRLDPDTFRKLISWQEFYDALGV